jgi:hypothetical protein
MTIGDILLVEPNEASTQTFQVAAGAANTISPGEPVVATPGTATVALAADDTPKVGTDYLIGIATSESTDTAAAAGTVDVYVFKGGEVVSGAVTTAANADTLTKIRAAALDHVTFNLASGAWTIAMGDGHAIADGLMLTGEGEPENSRVYARVRAGATWVGSDIAA